MSKPWFSTNRDGQTVADDLNGYLDWLDDTWRKPVELAISTAYFNPGGFGLLADRLERLGGVRLLLGADPGRGHEAIRRLERGVTAASAERTRVLHALDGHRRDLELDRDLLGFAYEADAGARRLVEWLRSGAVEVRRYERGFLHGKAFLVTTDDEGVLAGSSNFTYGGLARNLELNIAQYGEPTVPKVAEWFEQLWSEAEPFDLAAIYEARYEEHAPHLIYLRMLFERYGPELEEEGQAEDGLRLTTFQRDGVWRAKRILAERSGVVIADGVGLGKTFVAGQLIHEAVRDRRQRVLLIAPAALRDGPWRIFLKNQAINIDCISFEQLSEDRQLNPDGDSTALSFPVNEYAMVVIDEAHAYRNPDTLRAGILRRLLQGSPPKQLVLLTATPVNNTLFDLYYLLSYFIRNDAAFADSGIPSLREHFAQAAAEDPDDLTAEHLFDVLDAVAVRRTRHFIKRYYSRETIEVDGEPTPIQFPKPRVRARTYDLESTLPGFFARLAHALECADGKCEHEGEVAAGPALTLARYVPSRYLKGGDVASFQLQLAGLLRSGLLKRFESSAHAFALTCERMASSHDDFLALLDEGLVATGEALAEWAAMDSDELDLTELARREGVDRASAYDAEALRADVEADRDLLRDFAGEARAAGPDRDEKLELVARELATIAAEAKQDAAGEADERDKRKVLIFSYYADTVDWVAGFLKEAIAERPELAAYRDRVAVVSGSGNDTTKVLQGFAPRSSQAPDPDAGDLYDLVISTDVLAEGVNLQQARHIVNYDLPWNPMRLVQRHGRIDRIGSPHSEVFIRCILPDRELDDLLGLEERLQDKLKTVAATIGLEGEVLPGSAVSEQSFSETRREIELLRAGDASIFESGGETHAYSGEEYRQELRAGLEDPATRALLKALPWGAGSGIARPGATPGYVFCVRVADQPQPIFRWVDSESGEIVADTLACLARAACDPDTTRALPEDAHRGAYDAWERAREDIFMSWQHATDPANLQPRVPKPMRDAARLLRDNPPPEIEQHELDRLCDAIEAPYGKRIENLIRAAVRSAENPVEQARAVVAKVRELGLEPAPAPEPLPVIELEDVHLVCWLAIVGEPASG
jgi:hypothetical protein